MLTKNLRDRFGCRCTTMQLCNFICAFACMIATNASGQSPVCVVSILNRVAETRADGHWEVLNLPTGLGLVRARFTCVENGVTATGQSKFFQINPNLSTGFESTFTLGETDPVPESISLEADPGILSEIGATTQAIVTATYSDGSTRDATLEASGTTYTTSNPGIATVSPDGLVTAMLSGTALITARNEGILGGIFITVSFSGDSDADGIPDDVEVALGLNPENPVDAQDDADQDGLTALDEIARGTRIFVADTDGDGVPDGPEVVAATDPLDPNSVNYTGFLTGLEVTPPIVTLRTNTILPQEVTRQLRVMGTLEDGRQVDATSTTRGTTYSSSNLLVVNFGDEDGRLFAGNPGSATVTVRNGNVSLAVPVTVTAFSPVARGFVGIPGQSNNVDAEGNFAYVASGTAGLRVVNVSNPSAPTIVGSLDTPGNANDVKVCGHNVYVADGASGLQIIDISNPAAPLLLGSVDTPGNANDVIACGMLAYVADGASGLHIIDVSDPTAPFIVGSVDTPGNANGVDVDAARQLAAVADGGGGLRMVDISTPAAPILLGAVDTQAGTTAGALDVVLNGVFAYVADDNATASPGGGLVTVDTTNPNVPVITGATPPPGLYTDVVTFGGLALCSDVISVNAVHTFNITSPSAPTPSLLINFGGAPSFRDDNGTGIDAERGFVYMTGNTANGALHIGQFLDRTDDFGIPPTVTIVRPLLSDTIIEGTTITFEVSATDDVQVVGVQFFVNGSLFATDTATPFVAMVVVPLGATSITLGARALDLGDNFSDTVSRILPVVPDPPPVVAITNPMPGDTLIEGETTVLSADASDNASVVRVDFSTSTGFAHSDFTSPYTATFTVPTGITELTVHAAAFDNLSKRGDAEAVTVDVIPDPLTTVIGSVVDPDGNPVEAATVTTNGGASTATIADGSFSIDDVPTILGVIVASASATIGGVPLFGNSDTIQAVRDGTTDVGQIQLIPGFPNGNGGFETGDFTGYTTAGNASVIQSLGFVTPPEGTHMGMIRTGPVGTIGQITTVPFSVPQGVTRIAFRINFMTDELNEDSVFDDFFVARVLPSSGPPIDAIRISKNDMLAGFFPILAAPPGFDGMTGFMTASADVSQFAGTMMSLDFCFFVSDVGDQSVDSAALIDDIRFSTGD